MNSPLRYATFLVLLATVVTSGAAPDRHGASSDQEREVVHLRAAVQQLAAEVATLRRAVTGLELEQRRDRIRRIELELSRVRAKQARQWEADRAREHDLQDIEAALNRPDLTADQRIAMESARGELQTVAAGDEPRAVRESEERLLARLRAEHEAVKKLEDAWKRMRGGSTP